MAWNLLFKDFFKGEKFEKIVIFDKKSTEEKDHRGQLSYSKFFLTYCFCIKTNLK